MADPNHLPAAHPVALRETPPDEVLPSVQFLADEHWSALERVLPPPDANNLRRTEADRREFVEALLWMAFHGRGWSELPADRWNAESLRRKRQRWRERGWLDLLLHAAPSTNLPAWLLPIAAAAFASDQSFATSRGTWDGAAHTRSAGGRGTSLGTSGHVPRDMGHVPGHVPPLSRPMSGSDSLGHGAGRGADMDAGHGVVVVRLDAASIAELAKAIAEAGSGAASARGARGRGKSDLSVVWGDVPGWAKGGFAVVIALFTCALMVPVYLHGVSPFARDLHDSFGMAIWATTLIVVFGPLSFVGILLLAVYWMWRRSQASERVQP